MAQQPVHKGIDLTFKTGVQREKVDFEWEILNFKDITRTNGVVETQKICITTPDSIWHLRITEDLEKSNDVDYFIDIRGTLEKPANSEPGTESEVANWSLVAVAGDGGGQNVKLISNSYENPDYDDRRVYSTQFIHGKETLVASENCTKFPLLANGNLLLKGVLEICKRTEQSAASPKYLFRGLEKTSIVRLAEDIGDLLIFDSNNGSSTSEVEICTEDGVIIPAHRAILSARSEYFKAMFASGMTEQTTGKIKAEGIKEKAMKSLLHFLYSGTLDDNWNKPDIIHEFIKAAHFYQVKEVVDFLDKNVANICDLQSAGNLLLLCKSLEMKGAEKELRKLIKNSFMQTRKEDEFDDLLVSLAKNLIEQTD